MSNIDDLRALIAAEAEHAEATMNDPIPPDALARATRPNRGKSVPFTLRLNPDELAAVEQFAAQRGIPAATLARGWIVRQLAAEQDALTHDEQHVQAEPDPGLGEKLDRARDGIASTSEGK